MDELTNFYSNKDNLNSLRNFLRNFIYVNGIFSKEDDVRDTIEDIIQITYLKLYTNKGISCEKCSPKTVIMKSAKYNAFTELKQKKRWKGYPLENFEDQLFLEAPQEKNVETKELNFILNEEINKLGEPYKKTFLLYLEGYGPKEISKIQETTRNTIKSRLSTCKEKLRKRKFLEKYLHNFF